MVVDEMKLVGQLGEVDPLPAETFEQARTLLQAAIAVEGASQVVEVAHRPRRRRVLALRGGIGAGVAAAAAAVALMTTSLGQSPVPTAPNHTTLPGPSATTPGAPGHIASPLVRLANDVISSPASTGNATLVARTTAGAGQDGQSVTVYDLYADNGQYFFSPTESGLPGQVSTDHNLAGGLFAREIAAAKLAATGDVQAAAQDMADAPDPSQTISPTQPVDGAAAAAKQAATGQPQVGNVFDNWVWENSQDALIAGSGDPQVRAGVLRILATLPDVTVTPGTSEGQSTLVLAAGSSEMGYNSTEQLTINATTGVPMLSSQGTPGQAPVVTVSYQVSRVTTSDIAAGKF